MTVIITLDDPKIDSPAALVPLLKGAEKTLRARVSKWGDMLGPLPYHVDEQQDDQEIADLLYDALIMIKKLHTQVSTHKAKPQGSSYDPTDPTEPKNYANVMAAALKAVLADCDEALNSDSESEWAEAMRDQAGDTIYEMRTAMGLSEEDLRAMLASLK